MSNTYTFGPWLDEPDAIAQTLQALDLASINAELLKALQPFITSNSSEETITITVKTADVSRARAAVAKATLIADKEGK